MQPFLMSEMHTNTMHAACSVYKAQNTWPQSKFNQCSDWWRVIIFPAGPSNTLSLVTILPLNMNWCSALFFYVQAQDDPRLWKEEVWLVGPNGKLRLHLALTNTPVLLQLNA